MQVNYIEAASLPYIDIDPLERCGLLFAGANRAIEGKQIPSDIEDGILTAAEIATMDLSNTQLVVLSACSTALGDVTTEGVWGLQRAFKQAGAQTIVMTLWQVDDEATAVFMNYFYEELMRNTHSTIPNTHLALTRAQERMQQHPRFSKPYYWAAFVAID